jgi:rfaE bifunctional protein nucleotidyltransferase chain/domain
MERVVFTNGCFDIIHPGHIDLLKKARSLGTKLIVGINSDSSVRAIKGSPRPFLQEDARAFILKELRSVDDVRIFSENTPERLIVEIKPDVLVKGGDWSIEQIVGADFVLSNGGQVYSIPFEKDFSSSKIVEKIKLSNENQEAFESVETIVANPIESALKSHLEVFENLLKGEVSNIERCAEIIYQALSKGNKILFCADAESFPDARHFAFVFSANYKKNTPPALFLSDDLAEDSEDEAKAFKKFEEEIQSELSVGDLLIVLAADANSEKVLSAVMKARNKGFRTIGMTGADGKKLAGLCDAVVSVPTNQPVRLLEAHYAIVNIWREMADEKFERLR